MIDLSGLTMLDIYGLERRPMHGVYDEAGLSDLIINEWVPYYECHKCSRVDYCKFPQPINPGSYRMRDIQCGVVVASLTNFVNATFPLLSKISQSQLQAYLDGAFHLARFLFDTEIRIGSSMDSGYIQSLDKWKMPFFGRFVHLREHLDSMASMFSQIPQLLASKGVLLVEGESELAFVQRLKLSHMGWFIDLEVDTYSGKGKRGTARLEKHLRHLKSKGYDVFIEGDADGGATNVFDPHITKSLVDADNTFVFQDDFEQSVPARLAYSALKVMGYLEDISYDKFQKDILSQSSKPLQMARQVYGIFLDDQKVKFASALAEVISSDQEWLWGRDDDFLKTEFGRFLQFLRKVGIWPPLVSA